MASAMALTPVTVLISLALIAAMAFDPLGLIAKVGIWKVLAIVFGLLNLKNIPLAWHVSIKL